VELRKLRNERNSRIKTLKTALKIRLRAEKDNLKKVIRDEKHRGRKGRKPRIVSQSSVVTVRFAARDSFTVARREARLLAKYLTSLDENLLAIPQQKPLSGQDPGDLLGVPQSSVSEESPLSKNTNVDNTSSGVAHFVDSELNGAKKPLYPEEKKDRKVDIRTAKVVAKQLRRVKRQEKKDLENQRVKEKKAKGKGLSNQLELSSSNPTLQKVESGQSETGSVIRSSAEPTVHFGDLYTKSVYESSATTQNRSNLTSETERISPLSRQSSQPDEIRAESCRPHLSEHAIILHESCRSQLPEGATINQESCRRSLSESAVISSESCRPARDSGRVVSSEADGQGSKAHTDSEPIGLDSFVEDPDQKLRQLKERRSDRTGESSWSKLKPSILKFISEPVVKQDPIKGTSSETSQPVQSVSVELHPDILAANVSAPVLVIPIGTDIPVESEGIVRLEIV
jgi:hypothetical protein